MSEGRRRALRILSGVLGGGASLAVMGPALRATWDSVDKQTVTGTGAFVPVTELATLPEDGSPVSFPVVVEAPRDGWNRMPPTQVGSVWLFLRGSEVWALSTICPHLGCGIDWESGAKRYVCPCHDSYFDRDGTALTGPSPRGMDRLETRIVGQTVEVKFEKFAMGTPEQRPA